MKCYALVRIGIDDDIKLFGIYKNKNDAETDIKMMNNKAFCIKNDIIEIEELEFRTTCSKFYTVTAPAINPEFSGKVYVTGMTAEPIIPKRNYNDNTIIFSIDCQSELAKYHLIDCISDYEMKVYAKKIAKNIDRQLSTILDLIRCELNPKFQSNTTISLVDTWIPDKDKYLDVTKNKPELEYALNNALSYAENIFNTCMIPVKNRTLGYPITDSLINRLKEDIYSQLAKNDLFSGFNFRENPSLIPFIRKVITKEFRLFD
jgi:hypothetical protein